MTRKDLSCLLPLMLLLLAVNILSLQLPFFWDTILYSHIANWYLETGFSSLIPPQVLDTGNQPFFELLLALCWKALGRSLWVGHLLILPFLLGIAYQFLKLARRFLPENIIPAALVLLALEPTFLAQSTLASLDIVIVFLYLLGLNSILEGNRSLLLLAAAGLSLTNLRGLSLAGALALTEAGIDYPQYSLRKIKAYVPAAVIALTWLLWHRQHTGWFLVQPNEWAEHRQRLPLSGMLKNLLIIGWRLLDFGRAALWLVFTILLFKKTRKGSIDHTEKTLFLLILCPLAVMTVLYAPFSNPIGHRYFLIVYILFILLLAYELQAIVSLVRKRVVCAALALCLISGNFLIYPFPYSNGWDSTLAHLFYFKAREKMTACIQEHHIQPTSVAAAFPSNASYRYTDLWSEDLAFSNKYFGGISRYPYVMQSNINNAFQPAELDTLSRWKKIAEFRSGPVFIKLFQNPRFN